MQITINEKDLRNFNNSELTNLYDVISHIVRHEGDVTDIEEPVMTKTEPMTWVEDKPETEKPLPKKSASKVKAKKEPEPEPEEEQEDDEDLGLNDEEKPADKPKRTRKEMFSALQTFCKADKANAKQVREAINELGIAKVTDMTDEQMTEICEDMGI